MGSLKGEGEGGLGEIPTTTRQPGHLLDNIIGMLCRCSCDIGLANQEIVSKLKSGLQRDQRASINISWQEPLRDGVERLDNFLHGIAHSGYLLGDKASC